MPHYRDGTLAQIGDVVRGKGYNVRGPDGELKEIVGVIVDMMAATACNCKVAHICVYDDVPLLSTPQFYGEARGVLLVSTHDGKSRPVKVEVEYGQCDHFEKIGSVSS